MSADYPDFADFAALVGAVFTVQYSAEGVGELTLTACEALPAAEGAGGFDLRFEGASVPAEQGTYSFSAEGFAPAAVFVVPSAAANGLVTFEAHFSQKEH